MEAKEILERVVQMEADKTRHAWAWRDLGRVKTWLKFPEQEIRNAYNHAITSLPDELRFREELAKWERGKA